MAKIFELLGYPTNNRNQSVTKSRQRADCPFTNTGCDGGGNRYQTSIDFSESPDLRSFFDSDIEKVVPGVCSLAYDGDHGERWIVCPRRLMGFRREDDDIPQVNAGLSKHECQALREAGLPTDKKIGVWPEVHLNYEVSGEPVQYRFDYVMAPLLKDTTLSNFFDIHGYDDVTPAYKGNSERAKLVNAMRQNDDGLISGRWSLKDKLRYAPDLSDDLFLVEVMTASTSGSNKSKRTDIASAFEDAILQNGHEGPGINKRQVWGRMVTQLFAKSAFAEAWGGQTLWIVQRQLMKYIESSTQFTLDGSGSNQGPTIDFVSLRYSGSRSANPHLVLDKVERMNPGVEYSGDGSCTDILIGEEAPKPTLLKGMLRSEIGGIIKL